MGRVLGANPPEDPSEEREVTLSASDRHPFPFKDPTLSGSETILVVDDERFVRDFCASVLTQSGYEVLLGEKMLAVIRKRLFFGHRPGALLLPGRAWGGCSFGDYLKLRCWKKLSNRVLRGGRSARPSMP